MTHVIHFLCTLDCGSEVA